MKFTLSTLELCKHINSEDVLELSDSDRFELQRVMLEILLDVDSVCTKYSLKSYLAFGNALGAVRHKGFIPWDDDADIYMLRSDYEKFIKVFPLEMGEKYWLHTPENTKEHLLLLGKVRLKNTSLKTYEDVSNPECGVFIDVFVIENVPDNVILRNLHGTISMGLAFIASCRKFFCLRKFLWKIAKENPDFQFAYGVKVLIGGITAVLPMSTWLHINVLWNSMCKNESSRYLTIPTGRKHYFGEMMERKDILPGYRTDYEGKSLYVFQNIDKYLRKVYGPDYMTPPPADKIEKHAFLKPLIINAGTANDR